MPKGGRNQKTQNEALRTRPKNLLKRRSGRIQVELLPKDSRIVAELSGWWSR
jgi:hypothetical protein